MLLNVLLSFSIFGDFSEIMIKQDSQEWNSKYVALSNLFVKEGMIVSTANEVKIELNLQKGPTVEKVEVFRPRIFSGNKEWEINFTSNRIDFNWKAISETSKIDLNLFVEKVSTYLSHVVSTYAISYDRMAFNCRDVLFDFNEEKAKSIFEKFSKPEISIYKNKLLKQWSLQFAIKNKPNDSQREVNIVTSVQRINSNYPWRKNVDSIHVHYDCNTVVSDKRYIIEDEAKQFLNYYTKFYTDINNEIFS